MIFGGFQRFSLIDYPGELAAIAFTIGCNFRCPYCHNPELVNGISKKIEEKTILGFLKKRKGKLTALSITGGEPTLHGKDLLNFIKKVKDLEYKVKIDTNGTNPELLQLLIEENLIDYIAMDIKAPLDKYEFIVNSSVNPTLIRKSIEIISKSKVQYEFRTTVLKGLLSKEDIEKISKTIEGAELYFIQNFIPSKTLDPSFMKKEGLAIMELETLKELCKTHVKTCLIR